MAFFKLNDKQVLFKQQSNGDYISNDGFKIIEQATERTNPSGGEYQLKEYVLLNPQGEQVGEKSLSVFGLKLEDDREIYPLSYYLRTGKHVGEVIKWNPAHFPKGTVVQTKDLPTKPGFNQFTVKHIHTNGGAGQAVIVTEEIRTDGHFAGEEWSFNTSFVDKIISRPPVQGNIEDNDQEIPPDYRPKSNLPKSYVSLHRFMQIALHGGGLNPKSMGIGAYCDGTKLARRLKAMGLLTVTSGAASGVKLREALKFIKKNPHWVFLTIKETIRQQDEADRKMYESEYRMNEEERSSAELRNFPLHESDFDEGY